MEKMKMHSPDLTEENIAGLAGLFPNCVTEGPEGKSVDFDLLRQELSDHIVEGPRERYRLDWPGKREALLTANAPIAKTLRPCREESVGFDTTQNLFIEGDNLDALKLLQENYLGKVKMIYIDPPYNTGNDFIYEDDFAIDRGEYQEMSGVRDEEGNVLFVEERWKQNSAANGRFHSDWLSMMYPRLKLARNLMREDGVIFISIDDNEVPNLRKICDEVFGVDNFMGQFVWKSRVSEDTRAKTGLSVDHEYVALYRRGAGPSLKGAEKDLDKFNNPDQDPRGPWRSADMTGLATKDKRPNLHYDLVNPQTGINYGCSPKGWRFDVTTMAKKIQEERVLWPSTEAGRPRQKLFLEDMKSLYKNITSLILNISTSDGTREINAIFGNGYFDFPKPSQLLKLFVDQATAPDDIILDFFAGSCTTAHAVMRLNAEDGGKRRFIMVQLPEPCDEKSEAFKAGYATIAEIGKERICRAGKKVREEHAVTAPDLDTGFRVLKVDSSNMADVYYTPDAVEQSQLLFMTDNVKSDRTAEDLLFQVLLDWGLDLSLPVSREVIAGKEVFFVDDNVLATCFDRSGGITEELVRELAKHEPLRVVFHDAGYADDSMKINAEQLFKALSPSTEVKTL